jgi:hypothetical protein
MGLPCSRGQADAERSALDVYGLRCGFSFIARPDWRREAGAAASAFIALYLSLLFFVFFWTAGLPVFRSRKIVGMMPALTLR